MRVEPSLFTGAHDLRADIRITLFMNCVPIEVSRHARWRFLRLISCFVRELPLSIGANWEKL